MTMPGTDRKLDATQKDYVDDGLGGWETTTTIAPQLHHQILSRYGEWAGDPDSGSTIHAIPRKSNQATMLRVQDAWLAALQPFLDEGLAEDLVVQITRDGLNRFALEASLRDVQHGELDLSGLAAFGVGEGT